MKKSYFKRVMLAVIMMVAAMPSFADIEVWNIGKLQTMVNKVEDNEAGKVFVSPVALTSEDQIAAVDGFYQTEPYMLTAANAYSQDTRMTWYYYAKANPGYEFKGFVTTKTGIPTATALNNLNKVGDFYETSGRTSACGARPESNPVPLARYAVFEKTTTGGEGGEGDQTPLTNIKATGALYAKTVAYTEGENTTGVAQYVNLVGATLVANDTEDATQADQVTHIYVTFDDELATIYEASSASQTLASQISLINKSNGKKLNFNKYNCVVWSKDKKALDLMLSSEDFINNADHQGIYEFKLPAGVVKSAKGAVNDAYEFTFTYGDPDQAKEEVIINLADYVGSWKQKKEVGETITNPITFNVEKIGDDYFVTRLYGNTELNIRIVNDNNNFSLAATSANGYSFGTMQGGAVDATFTANGSTKVIMLEQFKYVAPGKDAVIDGECSFVIDQVATGISDIKVAENNVMYNLAGQKVGNNAKGLIIKNGKKVILK